MFGVNAGGNGGGSMVSRFSLVVFFSLLLSSLSAWGAPLKIRTLSQEGYEAKFLPSNTHKPGICIEIMRAIEKIDPDIKFVGVSELAPTSRIEEGLLYGDIDVFFGHLKTPERQAKYLYTAPHLYKVPMVLVARVGDAVQVNNWDDVRRLGGNGVVLVVKGTGQVDYLKSLGGLIVDDQSRLISSNFKKLLAGRGRFYYGSENTVREAMENSGFGSQLKVLPLNFAHEPLYPSFSRKTSPEVVKRITDSLKKLESTGELKRIRARYSLH